MHCMLMDLLHGFEVLSTTEEFHICLLFTPWIRGVQLFLSDKPYSDVCFPKIFAGQNLVLIPRQLARIYNSIFKPGMANLFKRLVKFKVVDWKKKKRGLWM